jgi:hypothetical protein
MSNNQIDEFAKCFDDIAEDLAWYLKRNYKSRIRYQTHNIETSFNKILDKIQELDDYMFNTGDIEFLHSCRYLRNYIFHNNHHQAIKDLNKSFVTKFKKIHRKVCKPITDAEGFKSVRQLQTAKWTDKVEKHVKLMKLHDLRFIPILVKGKLDGIFSRNTFYEACIDSEAFYYDSTTKLNNPDLKNYIKFDEKMMDYVKFVPNNLPIFLIDEIFYKEMKKGSKTSLLIVTEDGKANQKVEGMFSIWGLSSL